MRGKKEAAPADETAPETTEVTETEATATTGRPETTSPEAPDDSLEAGIEALRKQLAESQAERDRIKGERDEFERQREVERRAREEAERRARQHENDAGSARVTAEEAQYDAIVNALAAAQAELKDQKIALKVAMTEGDFDKAADISGEIGMIAGRLREFEAGKQHFDAERARRATQPQQPQQPSSATDPREEYLRTRTPRTAAWLRGNDRFFTDDQWRRSVLSAHDFAVNVRRLVPDTDSYFNFIEEQVGLRTPVPAATTAAPEPPPPPARPPTPAAPAAGSTHNAARPGTRPDEVRLSPEEREFCRLNDIPEARYAARKRELIEEGQLGSVH